MAKRTGIKRMHKLLIPLLVAAGAVVLFAWLLRGHDVPVLNPQGSIAEQQRDLIVLTVALGMIVVIPVFALTFGIVWRYREREGAGIHKAKYLPNWGHSRVAETIWWGIPIVLILILSVIIWKTSHALDPYRPIASDKKPVTVQVVALDWKWLFIYPEYNIASVNYVQFPEDTPVNFAITSDGPMNSFWIPSLGGQVYAMAGMQTKLHLEASNVGSYKGSSANLSGEGFAGMKFVAEATSRAAFDKWVKETKQSPSTLNADTYSQLAQPSKNNPKSTYVLGDKQLFDTVIMKYMMPGHEEAQPPKESVPSGHHDESHMHNMEHGSH